MVSGRGRLQTCDDSLTKQVETPTLIPEDRSAEQVAKQAEEAALGSSKQRSACLGLMPAKQAEEAAPASKERSACLGLVPGLCSRLCCCTSPFLRGQPWEQPEARTARIRFALQQLGPPGTYLPADCALITTDYSLITDGLPTDCRRIATDCFALQQSGLSHTALPSPFPTRPSSLTVDSHA